MKRIYNKSMSFFMIGIVISIIMLSVGGAICLMNNQIECAIGEIALAATMTIYFLIFSQSKKRLMKEYASILFSSKEDVPRDAIESFPLPTLITRIDGDVIWCNNVFEKLFETKELFNVNISDLIPEINWMELLKTDTEGKKKGINVKTVINDKNYSVTGNIINTSEQDNSYSVILYFIDTTEADTTKARYENEKTDIAFITIDNYDEIFQKMSDLQRQQVTAEIDRCVSEWVSEIKGVMKKVERDRYFLLFENCYLPDDITKKFDILERVRKIGEVINQPITLSIGIGVGGKLVDNDDYARSAIDMVQGRGGDQVAIKDSTQYKFYGGKSREYEKSTRVKTRAVAFALKDFVARSDKVIFMGHFNPDYDCFGAAMGLQRLARIHGKRPFIVLENYPGIKRLVDIVNTNEEYTGMMITPEQALEQVTQDTLVVILDTHRISMLPCKELLNRSNKVVLIDHHRQSTEALPDCSLKYHEPYASSTCEMVTEIMQYVDTERKLTALEAESLYLGIVMDTKNFVMKTGIRTFEAASWLKKCGVDTVKARQMLSVGKIEYERRADIVRLAKIVTKGVAVAACRENYENIRVIASQAADEMLTINGIKAAFVIYYASEGVVAISGRSLGDVNVQVILEKLGGGGHMTVAGAQFYGGETMGMVQEMLEESIKTQMEG